MKSADIKHVLETHDVMPSKSLGQNFLIDENMAKWIVNQLNITEEDCVVEVGPGTGALTEHVVGQCRRLILIEFDARLAAYQKERWADSSHVTVFHADGATWDPRMLFAEAPVKFLGNLPYSAGGAILQNFLSRPSPVSRAVVMLQKEFIDRILAQPGDDAYGLLSLRIQKNWVPKSLKTVPPEAFLPRPKIDSTVMLLTPRDPRENPPYNDKLMDELMRKGFSQRRKQLKKQLPNTRVWVDVAATLGISETVRPEELNLSQWIRLTNHYDLGASIPAQHSNEILDIVNEQDEVIDQSTRKEIHDTDLIHRAVHILVRNKYGHTLLQKRSVWKDRLPELWGSSASGHVDGGEDYVSAAHREIQEELGIAQVELTPLTILDPREETGWEHVHIYTVEYTGKINFPAAEIEAVQWFTEEQISAWIARRPQDFCPVLISAWQAWYA